MAFLGPIPIREKNFENQGKFEIIKMAIFGDFEKKMNIKEFQDL